ncbi:MAG: polyphosphate kinase 1 [Oscillospiraceae bacterium]|nr:polyphosphate kinase 1 [Oscillospiraceae bacterium]
MFVRDIQMSRLTDYYINRELSFLKFNKRVLEEADDTSTPLFERFKFISIFHSNLDEFYMIRVGGLYEKSLIENGELNFSDNKTGWSPSKQLDAIFKETKNLYKESDSTFAEVTGLLDEHNIKMCRFKDFNAEEKKWVKKYFKREIMPLLSPQIIDTKHPFPHLLDKDIYIILELNYEDKNSYGIIAQNKNISRIIELPGDGGGFKYILSEELICNYAKELFKNHRVLSKFMIRITRNADLNVEEELYENDDEIADDLDFRSHMDKVLKKRGKLAPVRLQISGGSKNKLDSIKKYLCEKLKLKPDQIFVLNTPLDLSFIFGLQSKIGQMREGLFIHEPVKQEFPANNTGGSIMQPVEEGRDMLLHFPKHSIKTYIKLLEEAVADPDVISVKITLYRLSENSQIIDCLRRLAEAGKQVTAVVELAARFDEENNINWSKRLEESGCTVIYGVEGYKIHSKITLITKKNGKNINYITHLSTGNYNEKTAKLYTDLGIITNNLNIGKDALKFFNFVATADSSGVYSCLLVAPLYFKSELIKLIKEETKKGAAGKIRLKMNSLTDREIIEALVIASENGVKTELIIRGICCLLPGVKDKTENIKIRSVVGRFLEHSRIFIFGEGRGTKIYISSADLMTRNTTRRLEIAAPVFDFRIKKELENIFDLYMRDNTKARELKATGKYEKIPGNAESYINAQKILFEN